MVSERERLKTELPLLWERAGGATLVGPPEGGKLSLVQEAGRGVGITHVVLDVATLIVPTPLAAWHQVIGAVTGVRTTRAERPFPTLAQALQPLALHAQLLSRVHLVLCSWERLCQAPDEALISWGQLLSSLLHITASFSLLGTTTPAICWEARTVGMMDSVADTLEDAWAAFFRLPVRALPPLAPAEVQALWNEVAVDTLLDSVALDELVRQSQGWPHLIRLLARTLLASDLHPTSVTAAQLAMLGQDPEVERARTHLLSSLAPSFYTPVG